VQWEKRCLRRKSVLAAVVAAIARDRSVRDAQLTLKKSRLSDDAVTTISTGGS